jgi:hypothetical protein
MEIFYPFYAAFSSFFNIILNFVITFLASIQDFSLSAVFLFILIWYGYAKVSLWLTIRSMTTGIPRGRLLLLPSLEIRTLLAGLKQ